MGTHIRDGGGVRLKHLYKLAGVHSPRLNKAKVFTKGMGEGVACVGEVRVRKHIASPCIPQSSHTAVFVD